MEATSEPSRQGAPSPSSTKGGVLEPADRVAAAKTALRSTIHAPQERYELRDPFAEVIYRTRSFDDIVAKAERLGSSRFIAIDEDGNRTIVVKVDGVWQRGAQRPPQPDPVLDLSHERDDESPPRASATPPPAAQQREPEPTDANTRATVRAERAALLAQIEAALSERYVVKRAPVTLGHITIGHTEYRFRGDVSRVAFTESTFRLATELANPSVARSMVDVAQARNWRALRVSGSEDFRRMVWLEASVRRLKTIGYEPDPADLEILKRQLAVHPARPLEPARTTTPDDPHATGKGSARGSGGRKAVLAAIDAVLLARRVPNKQRLAVLAAAGEKLAQRARDGQTVKVRVYDKNAPSHRPALVLAPELQRSRERAAPAR